jgi:tRNA threonylcarbamoyladenosine biosynthesis protein TsaE
MAPPASPHAGPTSFTTESEDQTRSLGERCGRSLLRPMAVFLIGDLGSGKTVFVQGLARGLDVPVEYYITSPSYTIINEYPGRLNLYHIDLYRLKEGLDPNDLGLAEFLNGDGVAVVEWADRLPAEAAPERLEIHFEVVDCDRRVLRIFEYGQDASRLIKAWGPQRTGSAT